MFTLQCNQEKHYKQKTATQSQMAIEGKYFECNAVNGKVFLPMLIIPTQIIS